MKKRKWYWRYTYYVCPVCGNTDKYINRVYSKKEKGHYELVDSSHALRCLG